jgi:hypothetical protein
MTVSLPELSKIASVLRTSARIGASLGVGNACLVSLSLVDRLGEHGQGIEIGSAPCSAKEADELVRVYVNVDCLVSVESMLLAPLRRELEPFIIGVGEIATHNFEEGFVITRARNYG